MLPRAGLVRIVTILALAAAPRCFSSDNTSLNPLPALWNESKSGSRAIMLHRIHKAGSSMITSFVVDVARQAMKAGPSTHWCVKTDTFHHAINTPCLFPSRAFLVAHLREPMRRLESVFFYHGPGKALCAAVSSVPTMITSLPRGARGWNAATSQRNISKRTATFRIPRYGRLRGRVPGIHRPAKLGQKLTEAT